MLADQACSHSQLHGLELIRSLKTNLGVATAKGYALFQACISQLTCKTGLGGGGGSEVGSMLSCRIKIAPATLR